MELRPFVEADFPAMGEALADPEVLRFTGSVHSEEEAVGRELVLDERGPTGTALGGMRSTDLTWRSSSSAPASVSVKQSSMTTTPATPLATSASSSVREGETVVLARRRPD